MKIDWTEVLRREAKYFEGDQDPDELTDEAFEGDDPSDSQDH